MTLQNIFDAMSESAQNQRSNYHVTLGELIDALGECDVALPVEFSDGTSPTSPHSYRGYYDDLALQSTDEEAVAHDLHARLKEAEGGEFTGYKGGQFLMDDDTPLWQAEYGSTGRPILNIERENDRLVLVLGESEF